MKKSKDLAKDPIPSLFFKYYVPALTSILSVTVHQVVNGLILAQKVGKEGVTAVGLFGPVFTIYIAFALALMIGSGILAGKNVGEKAYDKAQRVFEFSTTIALLFSFLVAINVGFISRFLAESLGGNGNAKVVASTFDYLFYSFLWMPFFLLRMLWGNFLANDHAPHISRNASIIGVVANIVLDILLIIVFPLGVAGASIATGISILISFAYMFRYFQKGSSHLSLKGFRFTLKLKEWKQLIGYGIPSFISELSFAAGLLIINKRLIPYGADAIAAFGIINHLSFIFLRLFTAAIISSLPIMSFNIGAQLPERVLSVLRFSLLLTITLGILVSLSGFLFADFLVNTFSGDDGATFVKVATKAVSLYFILFLAAGPNYLIAAFLQAIGKTWLSSMVHVVKGVVLIAVFVWILPGSFNLGVDGVWLSRSFTEIATLLFLIAIMYFNREQYFSHTAILRRAVTPKSVTDLS